MDEAGPRMTRTIRKLTLVGCGLLLLLPMGACGGEESTSSEEKLREEREQGRREGRNEQRLRQLERELRKKEKGGATSGGDRGGTSGGSGSGGTGGSGGSRQCGGGLSANSNTTCAFARNVRDAYEGTGSGTVEVYSPAIDRTYTMSCTGGSPHTCTGGNNAAVYFP